MLEKIIDYLKEKEWTFTYGKKPNILFFPVTGFNGVFNCVVDIDPDDFIFVCISFNGINCPVDKRVALAELLNRINSNLRYGNFELGMEIGEIKFRTSIYLEGIELGKNVIDNIILKNILAHDFSFPFLSKFLFGNMGMNEVYDNLYPPSLEDKKEETHLIEEK